MLFSSLLFLYLFLPVTLVSYFLLNKQFKNVILLIASLIFFAWGGVTHSIILIISIIVNYFFGLKIQQKLPEKQAYFWLFSGVTINLILLGIFKYANFIIENLNYLFSALNIPQMREEGIILPIGISFYTFHSLSYLVDVYKQKAIAQKNIFSMALYITMFFQLVAGPIIRYADISSQLKNRDYNFHKFSVGIERFLIGLAKKVLMANTFAEVADSVFSSDLNELSAINAWLGIICYTFQIYLDFSAYSDMAIGLAKMFGFEFLENFNYPYTATSINDFWRRWHISLSTFFRDYVYIPLGGNQRKTSRVYFNLFFVFLLTGFWHGASWNFILWGLFHGLFIVIERLGFEKVLKKINKPFSIIYTLLIVIFAWVLFRADTLEMGLKYWTAMFHLEFSENQFYFFNEMTNSKLYLAFIIAITGSFKVFHFFSIKERKIDAVGGNRVIGFSVTFHILSTLFYVGILLICTQFLIAGSYNPFIYYRF